MEILFVTHKYPPGIGGMEKQSYELINRMSAYTRVHQLCYMGTESKFLFFLKLGTRVSRILKRNPGISIVHFNDGVMAQFGLRFCNLKKVFTSATFHGLDVVFPNKIYRNWLFPIFKKLDRVICVSNYTKEKCVELGLSEMDISVVHNGVDHNIEDYKAELSVENVLHSSLSKIADGKKMILSIGRAVKRKGFSWFLHNVLPNLPDDYYYVMVGPRKFRTHMGKWIYDLLPERIKKEIDLFFGWPTDSGAIQAALQQKNISERAIHLGKVCYDELLALISKAYLIAMPNIEVNGDAEGFGLVALEANLRAKCVVASGIEGITDAVVDGENGLLITSPSPNEWVSAIVSIKDADACGQRAKKYVLKNYSWDKMTMGYLKIFKTLLA